MNDPIADMLIRIKNAYRAHLKTVEVPFSATKANILKILEEEGCVKNVRIQSDAHKELIMDLKYHAGEIPVIVDVKRVSKPGCRIYADQKHFPRMKKSFGFSIISTSQGLMTGFEAKKKGIGGEVMCNIITAG